MSTHLNRGIATLTAAAALFMAAPAADAAAADAATAVATMCTEEKAPERARADALQEEALQLMQRGEADEAAGLLEEAVELREPCDPARFDDLLLAARLQHTAGQTEKARLTLLRAAEHAVWTGDPGRAAHAYLDAALVAMERGLAREAHDAADRAELLAASPLLSAAERGAIVRRIERGTGVQAASR